MKTWIWRAILIILAVAFLPILINGVTQLAVGGINAVVQGISNLFEPFSMTGDAKLGGIIKLCLYLIVVALLVWFFLGRRPS